MTPDPEYPRFSDAEFERRRRAVAELMEAEGLDALLVHGAAASPGTVHYLTNYLAGRPTWLLYPSRGEPALFLHFANHLPTARAMSVVEDVRWSGQSASRTLADELGRRGLAGASLGVVGLAVTVPYAQFADLRERLPDARFRDVSRAYHRIRWRRSDEEMAWFARSAELTDGACRLLEERIRPGLSEHDLQAVVHEAFLPHGGQLAIAFVTSTSMANPDRFVPWQYPTARRLRPGDVVITEITVAWWGYGAQVHRPFAVGEEPAPLYRELFDVAYECYERVRSALRPGATSDDVVRTAGVIEERGFTVCDSVVHGEGGKNPELGTPGSVHAVDPWTFEEGQVMVIQPNPVAPDGRAGLQLGAAVRVGSDGGESLHRYPFAFPVCG